MDRKMFLSSLLVLSITALLGFVAVGTGNDQPVTDADALQAPLGQPTEVAGATAADGTAATLAPGAVEWSSGQSAGGTAATSGGEGDDDLDEEDDDYDENEDDEDDEDEEDDDDDDEDAREGD